MDETFYRSSMKLLRRQTGWIKKKKMMGRRGENEEDNFEDGIKEGSRN